jgi:hypothetical protein
MIFNLNYGQNDSIVKGKVVSEYSDLEGIHVVNKNKQRGSVTLRGGYFSITASVQDTIMFSSVGLKGTIHIVTEEDFTKDLLFIPMESLVSELNEVVMTEYKSINAESLGIIPKGMKSYTPAERRLKTASEFKLGTSMPLDGLINALSGRTKQLKKELKVERKQTFMELLSETYDAKFMVNTLKLPQEHVEGFLYYVVDEKRLIQAVTSKNNTMAVFLLSELATRYKNLIAIETN